MQPGAVQQGLGARHADRLQLRHVQTDRVQALGLQERHVLFEAPATRANLVDRDRWDWHWHGGGSGRAAYPARPDPPNNRILTRATSGAASRAAASARRGSLRA